jgi:hypothetical protein
VIVLAFVAVLSSNLEELRYCGPPQRDASGTIVRSSAVVRAFRKAHPCPVTGKTDGACPKWADKSRHPIEIVRLRCCLEFTAWMPTAIKSGPGILPKDRWERRIYKCPGEAIEITPMPAETSTISLPDHN